MDYENNMKAFISEFQITKDITAEKSIEICARLNRWLNCILLPEVDLSRVVDKLDIILYGLFILETLWQMHRRSISDLLPQNPLDFFTRKLLSTKNAGQLLPLAVHHYFKKYFSESKLHSLLIEEELPSFLESPVTNKVNDLVEKIFQLKAQHVPIAIDRLVEILPFEDVVPIFSVETKKYLILQNEICSRISNRKFINSIFTFCANDSDSFYKILLNQKFSTAVKDYLLNVLLEIREFKEEDICSYFNFEKISFLTGAMLHHNSPIKVQFYKSMNEKHINSDLLRYLSRMQIIYDY